MFVIFKNGWYAYWVPGQISDIKWLARLLGAKPNKKRTVVLLWPYIYRAVLHSLTCAGRPLWTDGCPAVGLISLRMADFSQYLYAAGRINHTHMP